jgi:hypothetical protein
MFKSAMEFIGGIFKPATDLIDNIHTSEEEKLELRNVLVKLQNEITLQQMALLSKQMDLEKQLLNSQTAIINAEANSESWLARNWRPISMVTFITIIVAHALGFVTLEAAFADQFMSLVQIGLGGYVVGRSAEKAAPAIAAAIGRK